MTAIPGVTRAKTRLEREADEALRLMVAMGMASRQTQAPQHTEWRLQQRLIQQCFKLTAAVLDEPE